MNSTGELVSEAIDLMDGGFYNEAFPFICNALKTTLEKSLETDDVNLSDYKNFIGEHWDLIEFMCLPNVKSQYLEKRFVIKEISLNPNRDYTVKEIVIFLITNTLKTGKLHAGTTFFSGNDFNKNDEKLFVPSTLAAGLLGLVIVHPINKNQIVPDKYWINISDFKMFVSEFWGRIDLAERVMKFYRERDQNNLS